MMLIRRLLLNLSLRRAGLATQSESKVRRGRRFVRFASVLGGGILCYYTGAFVIYRNTYLTEESPNTLRFNAYRLLPLNLSSRLVGSLASVEVPKMIRAPLYGIFVRCYGCNLDEAEEPNLENYPTFSAFFRRSLKPGIRPFDPSVALNSPCDGRVLFHGEVHEGQLEQVKGLTYRLGDFLGGAEATSSVSNHSKKNRLFHIILYLAPGDYHRFHAPTDWSVTFRRYFPGYLLSVKPKVAERIRGLFSINERVVYFGQWHHGFFSYSAVGACNVGKINVFCDKALTTNVGKKINGNFEELRFVENRQIRRGELFGEFNLGSTIVMIFEAPDDFKFCVSPGQKVQCGQALAL